MQKYELTVVVDGKATAAKKKKIEELIKKIIAVSGGKMGQVEDWGVKTAGCYLHFPLELEKAAVKGIEIKLNQETDLLRKLLLRVE